MALNLCDMVYGAVTGFRFLIRDSDPKFMQSFDTVFSSVGIRFIKTRVPTRSPNASLEQSDVNVLIGS